MSRQEVSELLKKYSKTAYEKYGSHSFSAGYFEAVVVELILSLPKGRQEAEMRLINQSLKRLEEV